METEECILTRRSIRKFKKTAVDMDKIGKILEAGRNAPSAGNIQDWAFIIVDDEEKIKNIAEACFSQDWMSTAPVHIVICSKPAETARHYGIRGERLYTIQNSAVAAENMILMAHDQGLGSCFVSAFDEDKIKSILNIVKEVRPQVIIPMGYSDEDPPIPSKYKLEDIVYINKWWGRIRDLDIFMGYGSSVMFRKLAKKGKAALEKARKKLQQ